MVWTIFHTSITLLWVLQSGFTESSKENIVHGKSALEPNETWYNLSLATVHDTGQMSSILWDLGRRKIQSYNLLVEAPKNHGIIFLSENIKFKNGSRVNEYFHSFVKVSEQQKAGMLTVICEHNITNDIKTATIFKNKILVNVKNASNGRLVFTAFTQCAFENISTTMHSCTKENLANSTNSVCISPSLRCNKIPNCGLTQQEETSDENLSFCTPQNRGRRQFGNYGSRDEADRSRGSGPFIFVPSVNRVNTHNTYGNNYGHYGGSGVGWSSGSSSGGGGSSSGSNGGGSKGGGSGAWKGVGGGVAGAGAGAGAYFRRKKKKEAEERERTGSTDRVEQTPLSTTATRPHGASAVQVDNPPPYTEPKAPPTYEEAALKNIDRKIAELDARRRQERVTLSAMRLLPFESLEVAKTKLADHNNLILVGIHETEHNYEQLRKFAQHRILNSTGIFAIFDEVVRIGEPEINKMRAVRAHLSPLTDRTEILRALRNDPNPSISRIVDPDLRSNTAEELSVTSNAADVGHPTSSNC